MSGWPGGHPSWSKRRKRERAIVVSLIEVLHVHERWPDEKRRRRAWLSPEQAAGMVRDPGLRELISTLRACLVGTSPFSNRHRESACRSMGTREWPTSPVPPKARTLIGLVDAPVGREKPKLGHVDRFWLYRRGPYFVQTIALVSRASDQEGRLARECGEDLKNRAAPIEFAPRVVAEAV